MPIKRHHEVTIYTNGSIMSGLAKDYFRSAGIDFDEVNIVNTPSALPQLKELTGEIGELPVVDFDGRIVTGYQPDVYGVILKESEDRDKSLSKASEDEDNDTSAD